MQGYAFFGVIKLKFNVKPLFILQNRQILAQNCHQGSWQSRGD